MLVEVKERHREYDGLFKLDRVILRHQRLDGRLSEELTRIVFERGDSAAVVLCDAHRQAVLLVEQFRYPVYLREQADGRLLEIVAGTIESGRSPEEVARAEIREEAGLTVESLEYVMTFYPSPGACSERIHLYLGYVSPVDRQGSVVRQDDEEEDIRVHWLPLAEALRLMRQGGIRDAKTVIALQHLALSRADVREVQGAVA